VTELQGEDYTNREGYKFLCPKINLWVDFVKKVCIFAVDMIEKCILLIK